MRVLVIESDLTILRAFEKVLADEGHEVSALLMADASDAKAAMWLVAKADVVLLGVVLMACDGPMLASLIQKRFPGVRIVVSSTLPDAGGEMVRIGAADALLPRPFELDELRAAIGAQCNQPSPLISS